MAEVEQTQYPLHLAAFQCDVAAVTTWLDTVDSNDSGRQAFGATPLHAASVCQAADPAPVIRKLLDHGAHPNAATDSGATALHLAAATGNARAIQALAAASDDLDFAAALPESRFTALHLAVASADVQSVKLLISFGASATASAHHGIEPLHVAAYLGVPDIAQALLDSGAAPRSADGGVSAVHCVCSLARPELVRPAVEAVACVDWLGKLPVSPHLMQALARSMHVGHSANASDGATSGVGQPLPDTAVLRKVSAVREVHEQSKAHTRRSWNSATVEGSAAPASAPPAESSPAKGGILSCLPCCGTASRPSPSAASNRSRSRRRSSAMGSKSGVAHLRARSTIQAISELAADRRRRTAGLLVAAGSNVDAPDAEGCTPLMLASQALYQHVVAYLLDGGAHATLLDRRGRSALHHSVASDGPVDAAAADACGHIIDALQEAGLDVRTAASGGETPLHLACEHGNIVAARHLVRLGADVNARDARGHTPLWAALRTDDHARSGQGLLVAFLLDKGAAFDVRDRDAAGTDIITHAVQHGDHTSAATLLARARARSAADAATVTADSWFAAAAHATVGSPLLKEIPADSAAAVCALRTAWERDRVVESDGAPLAPDQAMTASMFAELPGRVPQTEASQLLQRLCKRGQLHLADKEGNTVLHIALRLHRLPEATLVLRHNAPIAAANAAGEQALHIAAREFADARGLEVLLARLHDKQVSLDGVDSTDSTALCHVAAAGNHSAVAMLLAAGASAGAAGSDCLTPLHLLGPASVVRLDALRVLGSAPKTPASQRLASLRSLSGRAASLTRGSAGPGVSLFQQLKNLTQAFSDIVAALVEAGASLAARDSKGNQPLHHAATGASADLLQTLVQSGARTDATNAAGETPLHIAAKCKTVTTIKALVKAGANLEAGDGNKRTPLHYACYHSTSEVVSELCRLRANVNHVDVKGRTPLHVVVCRKHEGGHAYGTVSLPSCKALVQHNAKVNEPDRRLRTPLVLAYMHGHVRVGHYLWDRGADPAMSYGLHTALFVQALRVADIALVKHLLASSRTLEIFNKTADGQTFLEHLATQIAQLHFAPYAACMDELLSRRVPVTLQALATLWAHIASEATALRWAIDREYPVAMPHGGAAVERPRLAAPPAAVAADFDLLNSGAVPRGAAGLGGGGGGSFGSSVVSGGAHTLAPVSEVEGEASSAGSSPRHEGSGALQNGPGGPARAPLPASVGSLRGRAGEGGVERKRMQPQLETIASMRQAEEAASEGRPSDGGALSESGGARGSSAGGGGGGGGGSPRGSVVEGIPPRRLSDVAEPRGAAQLEDLDIAIAPRRAGGHARSSSGGAAAETAAVEDRLPVRPTQRGYGRSKSSGAAAVANVLRRTSFDDTTAVVAAQSFGAGGVLSSLPPERDDITKDALDRTPLGFGVVRWTLALGEQLARDQMPFMPRPLRIDSLRDALHASSLMLVLWRTAPDATTATLRGGVTALHLAARYQMWVAISELCTRGASLSARDDAGETPLDALLRQCRALERGQSFAVGASVGTLTVPGSGVLMSPSPGLATPPMGPVDARAPQQTPLGTPPLLSTEERAALPADVGAKVAEVRSSKVYRTTAQERLVLFDEFLDACLEVDRT